MRWQKLIRNLLFKFFIQWKLIQTQPIQNKANRTGLLTYFTFTYLKACCLAELVSDCHVLFNLNSLYYFRMYDVDGNGWIDLGEMTRLVGSIYKMLGQHQLLKQATFTFTGWPTFEIKSCLDFQETASDRAKHIFEKMDLNSDGKVTRDEFMKSCMDDENMINLLTPPG